ncbi:MAG: universal stress protein [Thermodesulfobacteriota bacterium]
MELPVVKIKKILYTTDLSKNSKYAFGYAVNMAQAFGAGLTILHVMTGSENLDANISYHIGKSQWDKIKKERHKEATKSLVGKIRNQFAIKDALVKYCKGADECLLERTLVTDEIIVERGDPVKHILKYSEERDCDFIVMGSRRSDSLASSTSKRVLKKARIPVMVVPLNEDK